MELGATRCTLIVLTYNQQEWVGEALQAAFAQDYSPLQISISDDCSTDGTFEIAQAAVAAYAGPHQVILSRTKRNMGVCASTNNAVRAATGDFIVVASGDDVSYPSRVTRLVAEHERLGSKSGSLFSKTIPIDSNGKIYGRELPEYRVTDDMLTAEAIGSRGGVAGCAQAYTKDLFDRFGYLPDDGAQEDYLLAYRAALVGKVHFVDEVLVRRRVHERNYWNNLILGRNRRRRIREQSITRIRRHLPDIATMFGDLECAGLATEELQRLRAALRRHEEEERLKLAFFEAGPRASIGQIRRWPAASTDDWRRAFDLICWKYVPLEHSRARRALLLLEKKYALARAKLRST
ncbi:MAG: glycosyltransferase [Polyangiaceae bacterium]